MWKCTKCGQEIEDQFTECSQCAVSKLSLEDSKLVEPETTMDDEDIQEARRQNLPLTENPEHGIYGWILALEFIRGKKRLKEHDGSRCSKCGIMYFTKYVKCRKCDSLTTPIKLYNRFCVERVVFIATLVLLLSITVPFFKADPDAKWAVPLLSAFLIPAMYVTVKIFMGIGGFVETFPANAIPPRAYSVFSWSRYLSEIIRIIGIASAMLFLYLIVELFRRVF